MKYVRFLIAGSDGKGGAGYSVLSAGKPVAADLSLLSPRHRSSSHHTKREDYDQAIHD